MKKLEDWLWQDKDETASTNDDAANFASAEKADKLVFSAKVQTAGRGKPGRNWKSGAGNLMFSMLFEYDFSNVGMLSLLCGLTVLKTVAYFSPKLETKLKWPNDVFVCGKKICGILIEKKDECHIIVGIGINLKSAPSIDNALYQAASLAEFGISVGREEFLHQFLRLFNLGLAKLRKKEFNEIKNEWLQYAENINKEISVKIGNTEQIGIMTGVDENGALLLMTANGTKKVAAGDVYER